MTLPCETLRTGGDPVCPDCKLELKLKILSSIAGYYIGTYCNCGPYSRESGYYKTRDEAKRDLDSGAFSR